jgi:nucleotide-binding universal stress UspA family protein
MSSYRIVVGVDGSEDGDRALDWAAREAERRDATVQAVIAWTWDGIKGAVTTNAPDERTRAEEALARSVGAVRIAHPGVAIAAEAVEGGPARVLTRAARDADLLVLGSHGHSRLYHAVLGSVAHECLRLATSPVLVVPVPRPDRTRRRAAVEAVPS